MTVKRKCIGWARHREKKTFFLFWIPVWTRINVRILMEEMLEPLRRELQSIKYISLPAMVKHASVFAKYKGIHRGRDIVLVATGPSVNTYKPIPGAVHIGVNRAYQLPDLPLDYLFMQDGGSNENPHMAENETLADYRKGKCVKFFGHNMYHPISEAFYERCGAEEYYLEASRAENPYSRVALDLECQPFCCSCSVILVAFQFALWCRPRRIYIVGCDTANNGYGQGITAITPQTLWLDGLLEGWRQMAEFARKHYPDIEIVSVNPVGLKGMFRDMEM